jgi:hypothetical protein
MHAQVDRKETQPWVHDAKMCRVDVKPKIHSSVHDAYLCEPTLLKAFPKDLIDVIASYCCQPLVNKNVQTVLLQYKDTYQGALQIAISGDGMVWMRYPPSSGILTYFSLRQRPAIRNAFGELMSLGAVTILFPSREQSIPSKVMCNGSQLHICNFCDQSYDSYREPAVGFIARTEFNPMIYTAESFDYYGHFTGTYTYKLVQHLDGLANTFCFAPIVVIPVTSAKSILPKFLTENPSGFPLRNLPKFSTGNPGRSRSEGFPIANLPKIASDLIPILDRKEVILPTKIASDLIPILDRKKVILPTSENYAASIHTMCASMDHVIVCYFTHYLGQRVVMYSVCDKTPVLEFIPISSIGSMILMGNNLYCCNSYESKIAVYALPAIGFPLPETIPATVFECPEMLDITVVQREMNSFENIILITSFYLANTNTTNKGNKGEWQVIQIGNHIFSPLEVKNIG